MRDREARRGATHSGEMGGQSMFLAHQANVVDGCTIAEGWITEGLPIIIQAKSGGGVRVTGLLGGMLCGFSM